VEPGRIVLRGKLKAANWMHPQNAANSSQWKVLQRANYGDKDPYLRINVRPDAIEADFNNANADLIPVFLFKILERKTEPELGFQHKPPMGLVLRKNRGLEYTRPGVFEFILKGGYNRYYPDEFDRHQESRASCLAE
jgi:hypothetical protein